MTKAKTREFKRGIDKQDALEGAKVFFSSPLGKRILTARHKHNGSNPFHVCIRNNYFNVYWNGCSVLKFSPNARDKNTFKIHDKYVHENSKASSYLSLEPKLQLSIDDLTTITRKDWSFVRDIISPACDKNGDIPCLEKYASRKDDKSPKEKSLLKSYLGKEKPFLLDLEVAFTRLNDELKPVADRIDMAEVVYVNNAPALRLVEVKASDDSRLRARDPKVLIKSPKKIMHQMERYQKFIHDENSPDDLRIQKSYRNVAANMLKLGFAEYMVGIGERTAAEVLQDFAERGVVDSRPHLLILAEKENGYVTDKHFKFLQKSIGEKYPELRMIFVES